MIQNIFHYKTTLSYGEKMETTKIFNALHAMIVNLDLSPESVINISEVAQKFKVSRTPVKEAMILLQAEGLVIRHGSHFMVTPLSLDRIKEITEIRSVLEVQANIWAMNRMNPTEMKQLEEINKEIIAIENEKSNRKIIDLDYKFHRLMYQATKNNQMAQFLERLLRHCTRFWNFFPRNLEPRPFFKETREMIKAIKNKDESLLRMATIAHIRESVEQISDFVTLR